ncbi:MAG: hypothetical protein Q9169_002009 [Polycauliona sp. 2 TL-2023]
MRSYSSMLATALALSSAAEAHMKFLKPEPYTNNGDLQNAPLKEDGSDFPCHMENGAYTPPLNKNAPMAVGSEQQIQLLGSAIHGGGSCQIALSTDKKPTKTTKWMVIHSIEGGCPAGSTTDNLPENAKGTGSPAIKYKIPEGIKAGEYTLGWTWFNKMGNQEMYMNCAPVTVTGGTKKRYVDEASFNETQELASDEIFKRDETFPDIFKANIGQAGNGCKTASDQARGDIVFPNPGKSLVKMPGMVVMDKGGLMDGCGASSAAASGPGSGGASPSAGASGSAPSASAGESGTPTVTGEGSDMGSDSSSPSGAASPSISIVAIPPPGAPAAAKSSAAASPMATGSAMDTAAPAVPASTGTASSGSTGSAKAGGMPCNNPGKIMCSPDGKMFGTCDMNKMAVMMPVAAGTKCSGGAIAHARRSARFARGYGRHY